MFRDGCFGVLHVLCPLVGVKKSYAQIGIAVESRMLNQAQAENIGLSAFLLHKHFSECLLCTLLAAG